MSKVQEYPEAGKHFENRAPGPWRAKWDADFMDDAQVRLPRYRRAIEAALAGIAKMEHRDGSRESQTVDYALAYVREAIRSALLPDS